MCIYAQFGSGPRVCPGSSLSLLEGPMLLAHILHRYDITLACPAEEVARITALVLHPSKLPLVFTPRK